MNKSKEYQKRLEAFFQEERIWYPNYFLFHLIAVILIAASLIIMIFPYHMWEKSDFFSTLFPMYLCYNFGILAYSTRYHSYNENIHIPAGHNQTSQSLHLLFQYLPVDREEFRLFRLKKVGKLCLLLTGCTLLIRIPLSFFMFHLISIFDILIPIGLNLLFPLLMENFRER